MRNHAQSPTCGEGVHGPIRVGADEQNTRTHPSISSTSDLTFFFPLRSSEFDDICTAVWLLLDSCSRKPAWHERGEHEGGRRGAVSVHTAARVPAGARGLHVPAHTSCREAQPRPRRKSQLMPCAQQPGMPEGAGGGATLSGRLRQISAAALRTVAAGSAPLVTKASVDAREAAAKTAAASSVQVEARILRAASQCGPGVVVLVFLPCGRLCDSKARTVVARNGPQLSFHFGSSSESSAEGGHGKWWQTRRWVPRRHVAFRRGAPSQPEIPRCRLRVVRSRMPAVENSELINFDNFVEAGMRRGGRRGKMPLTH